MSGLLALYGARLRGRAKWILTLVKVGSCLPEFTSRPLALLTIPELGPNCAYFSCLAGVGSAFKERPPGSPTVSGSYQRRQVAGAAPVNGRFWPSTVAQWVGCERQQRVRNGHWWRRPRASASSVGAQPRSGYQNAVSCTPTPPTCLSTPEAP